MSFVTLRADHNQSSCESGFASPSAHWSLDLGFEGHQVACYGIKTDGLPDRR